MSNQTVIKYWPSFKETSRLRPYKMRASHCQRLLSDFRMMFTKSNVGRLICQCDLLHRNINTMYNNAIFNKYGFFTEYSREHKILSISWFIFNHFYNVPIGLLGDYQDNKLCYSCDYLSDLAHSYISQHYEQLGKIIYQDKILEVAEKELSDYVNEHMDKLTICNI